MEGSLTLYVFLDISVARGNRCRNIHFASERITESEEWFLSSLNWFHSAIKSTGRGLWLYTSLGPVMPFFVTPQLVESY